MVAARTKYLSFFGDADTFASWISWSVSDDAGTILCSGGDSTRDGFTYTGSEFRYTPCCLGIGSYTLACNSNRGYGWWMNGNLDYNGAELRINGDMYCDDFDLPSRTDPNGFEMVKALNVLCPEGKWCPSSTEQRGPRGEDPQEDGLEGETP